MSAGTDPRTDYGTDREVAFFDLFDPAFQPDAPEVRAAREACWYARTSLGICGPITLPIRFRAAA